MGLATMLNVQVPKAPLLDTLHTTKLTKNKLSLSILLTVKSLVPSLLSSLMNLEKFTKLHLSTHTHLYQRCTVAGGALKTIAFAAGYRPGCDEIQKGDYVQIGTRIVEITSRNLVSTSSGEFNGQCEVADVTPTDEDLPADTTGQPCYRLNANL